jgi:hypothetical protein
MKRFYSPLFSVYKYNITPVTILWFVLAIAAVTAEAVRGPGAINNYLIFKNVFRHTIHQQNLYVDYPSEYFDQNHYGPAFSILIAPFALLPDVVGVILWCLLNAWILYYAINKLNIEERKKQIIYLIAAVEMMTSVHNVQFNPMLAAFLILAFVYTERGKDFWATLFIAAGFLIKIYGIAGLLFFVFSKNKKTFVLSFIFWVMMLFVLPMIISSPHFVIQSYRDWFDSLVEKNSKNLSFDASGGMQDISVMGMMKRMSQQFIPNWMITVPAGLLIMLPLLRFKQYKAEIFRIFYLCIVLLSVVIFSSSAESATYVIAVTGAAVWYVTSEFELKLIHKTILILLLILTIFSPTDLVPAYIKVHFIRAYSLKALPCLMVWLLLIYHVSTRNFLRTKSHSLS